MEEYSKKLREALNNVEQSTQKAARVLDEYDAIVTAYGTGSTQFVQFSARLNAVALDVQSTADVLRRVVDTKPAL